MRYKSIIVFRHRRGKDGVLGIADNACTRYRDHEESSRRRVMGNIKNPNQLIGSFWQTGQ